MFYGKIDEFEPASVVYDIMTRRLEALDERITSLEVNRCDCKSMYTAEEVNARVNAAEQRMEKILDERLVSLGDNLDQCRQYIL